MKNEWKRLLKIALCVFGLFLAITYWKPFVEFVKLAMSAATPLLIGGFLAFFVNIIMSRYEKWFFPKKTDGIAAKLRRPLCMIGAILTVMAVLALVIWLIVPQLISCIQLIISFISEKVPKYITDFIDRADNWAFVPDKVLDYLAGIDWKSKIDQFVEFISAGVDDVVNTAVKTVMGIFSGIVTGVLSIIFSVYLLLDKDRLKRQFKTLAENYLPQKSSVFTQMNRKGTAMRAKFLDNNCLYSS